MSPPDTPAPDDHDTPATTSGPTTETETETETEPETEPVADSPTDPPTTSLATGSPTLLPPEVQALVRELLITGAIAFLVLSSLYLFTGVWPPFVAVESNSMAPNMERGDLILLNAPDKHTPTYAHNDTGVATTQAARPYGHTQFNQPGNVIVYQPNGSSSATPVIHRAHFWVNESENWYQKANVTHLRTDDCAATPNCPAPHDGFITKGDNNPVYDQVAGISGPVKPEWLRATADRRLPYIGHFRLLLPGGL